MWVFCIFLVLSLLLAVFVLVTYWHDVRVRIGTHQFYAGPSPSDWAGPYDPAPMGLSFQSGRETLIGPTTRLSLVLGGSVRYHFNSDRGSASGWRHEIAWR